MSKTGCIISHEGIEYLCGLIRDINGLDTNLIDDLNIKSNGTFSSVRINTLLNALKTDCNDFANSLVSNLSRLELRVVTDESDMIEHNKLYLIKKSGETSYSQYVIVTNDSGVDEKILLGTTDINMTDYYTITQADNKFVLKTDFDALKTEVDKVKTTLGADSLNTTSQTVTGAINELNDKSTMVTLTQAEYNQLVADGTIDNDTYYIISDDSENIEITQTISSSSTKNEVPSALATFNLLKTVYPVGSIYINTTDVNPSTIFGFGTWKRVAQNMTLWGSSTDGQVGTTKSAGLPNIVGQLSGVATYTSAYANDTLIAKKEASANLPPGSGPTHYSTIAFNASKSSSIYGNSTTVQPPALVVNIWKRTA